MPRSRLRPAANRMFAGRLRKNGRWTKLWEIVFEFHQTPSAMTGMTGAVRTTAAWARARAGRNPSRPDIDNMPRRSNRALCQDMPVALLVLEVQQRTDRGVIGSAADARDASVH